MIKSGLKIFIITIISMPLFATCIKAESVSFYTIRENMKKMNDSQFKKYVKSLEGERVTWTGWVDKVKEKLIGGYDCLIDMDSPETKPSVYDVTFKAPAAVAKQLTKDEQCKFSGKIQSIMKTSGSVKVTLTDVKFSW